MILTLDSYTHLIVDTDAPCHCHQASGDSPSCPYHYPKPTVTDLTALYNAGEK